MLSLLFFVLSSLFLFLLIFVVLFLLLLLIPDSFMYIWKVSSKKFLYSFLYDPESCCQFRMRTIFPPLLPNSTSFGTTFMWWDIHNKSFHAKKLSTTTHDLLNSQYEKSSLKSDFKIRIKKEGRIQARRLFIVF